MVTGVIRGNAGIISHLQLFATKSRAFWWWDEKATCLPRKSRRVRRMRLTGDPQGAPWVASGRMHAQMATLRLLRRWLRGVAHDEMESDARNHGRINLIVRLDGNQLGRGQAPHIADRHADRCQGRAQARGQWTVIESNDRELLWDRYAESVGGFVYA